MGAKQGVLLRQQNTPETRREQLAKSLVEREIVRESVKANGRGWQTGELPKRSNGADCKSAGSAFAGSNPALPIEYELRISDW